MAKTSTYLNFAGKTEEAFLFYKNVFGGEFINGGIRRFGDMAPNERDLVQHIELEITGGHILMGSDLPESMGFKVVQSNNVHINLELDTSEEADNLFLALAVNGTVTQSMQDMFWGAYYGSITDQFGINWMINVNTQP
jgi:PhnB protein